MLPSSSLLLLLLPLIGANPLWDNEYLSVCDAAKKHKPFQDYPVYKQCFWHPKFGGRIDIVGCSEPSQGRFVPTGKEITAVDAKTRKVIMESEGEERTDICEVIDGIHQYRIGSRRTKEYAAFLKKNKLCEKHGLKNRFLHDKLYKECRYQQGKGGSVEILACKAKGKLSPLNVGGYRHHSKNVYETCTKVKDGKGGWKVVYSYRTLRPEEIEREAVVALCKKQGFTAVFEHNGIYQRCKKNGNLPATLEVIGCISVESVGKVISLDTRLESDNGTIERCEAVFNEKGQVIGAKLYKEEEEDTTPTPDEVEEPVGVETNETQQVEPLTESPSTPPTFTEEDEETRQKCSENGIDVIFFERNVAKRCFERLASNVGVDIEVVGCRFALSDTVVALGEVYTKWDVSFRCVVNADESGVQLVVEDPEAPSVPPTEESPTEIGEKCARNGFNVFFEGNVAKQCFKGADGLTIEVVGCRFSVFENVVLLGQTHEDWGVLFRCVANDKGGVQLVIEDNVSYPELPTPAPLVAPSTLPPANVREICNKHGFEKVFFEQNAAKKCYFSPEEDERVVLKTIGCRFALTEEYVLLGEEKENWGVTFQCIENEKGGVHLAIKQSNSSAPAPPPVNPSPPTPSNEDVEKILKTCEERGYEKVFFEKNAAKQCTVALEEEGGVVIKTIGCRFALTEEYVLLGESHETWGVTFECIENEKGGVHLAIKEEKDEVTTPAPVNPKSHPHCTFNGVQVPYKSRVIVGGQFVFECIHDRHLSRLIGKSPRARKHSDLELRFLGCNTSDTIRIFGKNIKRRRQSVSEAVCDLSKMDTSSIVVIE